MYRPGMAEDWEPGEVRNTRSASRPSAPRPSDSRPSDPRVSVSRGSVPRPPAPRPPWNGWEAAREERERMMERIDGVNECIDGVNERIDGVSARLDEFAATTNARLEEQGVVLTQLKHMLAELLNRGEAARLRGGDDLEGDVDGGGVDGMGDGGDPMADEKLAQKLLAGRRAQMWDGPTTRAWWLLSGDLPKNSLQRTELRDLLSKKALVTAAVATQLQTLSGLDVGAFLPPGVDLDVATNLLIDRQMRVLGNSILLVVGEEASNAGRTRASQLSDAFNEGITLVEDHCMEQLASLQQPENRRNMVNLVNDDLRAWTLALHLASAAAARKWASPPGILDLPPIVVPSWRKLRAFIETGVILNDA
ncbi:unnamed protein product, partial [Laminaria digitata]